MVEERGGTREPVAARAAVAFPELLAVGADVVCDRERVEATGDAPLRLGPLLRLVTIA